MEVGRYSTGEVDWRQLRPGINARQTWQQTGLKNYHYVLETRCFCERDGQTQIYILNGVVVKAVDLGTGRDRRLDALPTIPDLFRLIDTLSAQHPDRLVIEHDRHLGYPTRIFADPSLRTADDETDHRISDLKLLIAPQEK